MQRQPVFRDPSLHCLHRFHVLLGIIEPSTCFIQYSQLESPTVRKKKLQKKKSLISKRPEVSAYLTCPPFNSHSLCTLDTSVILHTGITKKASKSLPTVKQTNANSLFLMEVSSLLKSADFFPMSLTKTTKSVKHAFVTERLSIQKVFCKLV